MSVGVRFCVCSCCAGIVPGVCLCVCSKSLTLICCCWLLRKIVGVVFLSFGAFCADAGSLLRFLMIFGHYAGSRFMFCGFVSFVET